MSYQFPPRPPGNPVTRFIGAVLGLIIMAGLFFLGLTVFAAVAGLAIVLFAIFYIRAWWLMRRIRRQQQAEGGGFRHARPRERESGVTIEGEYEERTPRE